MLNDNLWYPTDKIFINGQWKDCHSKNRLPIDNPSNGEVIAEISDSCDIDIDEAVNSASKALDNSWGDLTASERGRLLLKLSELVRNRIDNLALIYYWIGFILTFVTLLGYLRIKKNII